MLGLLFYLLRQFLIISVLQNQGSVMLCFIPKFNRITGKSIEKVIDGMDGSIEDSVSDVEFL